MGDESETNLDETAIGHAYQQIGAKITEIVTTTVEQTQDDDLDTAVNTLHARLNAVDGVNLKREFSQHAVETLRSGETLKIDLQ